MKASTYLYKSEKVLNSNDPEAIDKLKCQLVFGFGNKELLLNKKIFEQLRATFPAANIAMCSTAGEIYNYEVLDNSLSVMAIEFEHTPTQSASVNIDSYSSSYDAGADLISKIDQTDLKYIFVLSDGGKVNGSELVRGIESIVQHKIPVTGGLAGDGTHFLSTLVGLNEQPESGNIVAIGFYGNSIKISHGSMGGWEMFGLEKTITRSVSNELFEINNVSALDIYKQYLGKYANELPGSALLFPLSIKLPGVDDSIVRTILSVNNENKSMVFAGDVPEGAMVRFMKANFDKLIDAASDAAQNSLVQFKTEPPKLSILISCVGRKLVLADRVDEEVEAVKNVFGEKTVISGFYSYGEISPLNINTKCELHNQTMTITSFDEI
jgi:hypothetical protein